MYRPRHLHPHARPVTRETTAAARLAHTCPQWASLLVALVRLALTLHSANVTP